MQHIEEHHLETFGEEISQEEKAHANSLNSKTEKKYAPRAIFALSNVLSEGATLIAPRATSLQAPKRDGKAHGDMVLDVTDKPTTAAPDWRSKVSENKKGRGAML